MKKTLSILTIALFVFVSLSFVQSNSKDSELLEIKLSKSINSGVWGEWNTTSCFKGLDFRVKKKSTSTEGKYEWLVQFRNRYNEKIVFMYEMVPYNERHAIENSGRTTNYVDLKANYTESSTHYRYLNESNSVYVYINKVRFGGSSNYAECDK